MKGVFETGPGREDWQRRKSLMWRLAMAVAALYAILAVYWLFAVPPIDAWTRHAPPALGALVTPMLYLVTYGLQAAILFLLLVRGQSLTRLVASRQPPSRRVSAMVVAVALVTAGVLTVVTNPATSGRLMRLSGTAGWALSGLSFLVVAAGEEFLFRAVLQTTLIRLFNPTAGVLGGAVLFAGFHVGEIFLFVHATPAGAALQFFGDFASGVLGGILAWRSGSLAIPTAIHWLGDWNPWAGTALGVGSTWGGVIPWAFYLGSLALLELARYWARVHPVQYHGDPNAAVP
ncbi:MAG: CPBP family intramembrane glutamic endopeptidase [Clostridia bacterium]